MEDALSDRLWVNEEDESSKVFLDNLLTIFTGSGPTWSQLLTSNITSNTSKPEESQTTSVTVQK